MSLKKKNLIEVTCLNDTLDVFLIPVGTQRLTLRGDTRQTDTER